MPSYLKAYNGEIVVFSATRSYESQNVMQALKEAEYFPVSIIPSNGSTLLRREWVTCHKF